MTGTCNGFVYSIGGAILDRDEPSKVLYRCSDFLLTPEAEYEEQGFVPNVCFPCATLQDAATGRIALYYGCADSYVGLAFTTADEVVDYIKAHDNAGRGRLYQGPRQRRPHGLGAWRALSLNRRLFLRRNRRLSERRFFPCPASNKRRRPC